MIREGKRLGAIWDVDGTLLDSMAIWDRAGELYLRKKGKPAETGLADALNCMSMEEGASYMKTAYGLTDSVGEIVAGVAEVIEDFYRNEVMLKQDVIKFLTKMQELQAEMVIATTGDGKLVEAAFERLGILGFFNKIFTCTEVGAGKTSPDIFFAAAAYLDMEPEQIWVFEDALYAARTAKNAGFRVAGVYDESGREQREELERISDVYLQDMNSCEKFWEIVSGEKQ